MVQVALAENRGQVEKVERRAKVALAEQAEKAEQVVKRVRRAQVVPMVLAV